MMRATSRSDSYTRPGYEVPEAPDPATNLAVNSKLSGAGSGAADNWADRFPGTGTATYSATVLPDHRKVRLVSSSTSDHVGEEQIYNVEAGKRYCFSVVCTAVDDQTGELDPVINHAPYSGLVNVVTGGVILLVPYITYEKEAGVDPRPLLGEMIPGRRYYYIVDAVASGPLKFIMGLYSAVGDVTLEQPQIEEIATDARVPAGYAATDPATPPPPPAEGLDWETIAHAGIWEGSMLLATWNMSRPVNTSASSYKGYRMTMRKSGNLVAAQFQLSSNFVGESSKSAINGACPHPYPAEWDLGFRVFAANASWQIAGSALAQVEWTYRNIDGTSGSNPATNDVRIIFEMPLNLDVTEGQRLLFLVYSRESSPSLNWCSLNMTANQARPAFGQEPPIAVNRYIGDDPVFVEGSASNLQPHSTGCLNGLGIRYSDGIEYGGVEMDCTPSEFRRSIGGSSKIRQSWSTPYYRQADKIALGVYRDATQAAAQADLLVKISGSGLTTVNLTIPKEDVQLVNPGSSSLPYTNQVFDLPGLITLAPDVTYTIEVSSAGTTAGRYKTQGVRDSNKLGVGRSSGGSINCLGITQPSPFNVIQPNLDPNLGDGEYTTNGSSWDAIGYNEGGGKWPLALFVNRRMQPDPFA